MSALAEVPRPVLKSALGLYLAVHSRPELSGAERETAAALATALESCGLTVTRGVGGHGVVGLLHNGPGPTVLLRTELDALPVEERSGLPYASTVPGVMHACGHDLHLAALTGAVELLADRTAEWSGTLMVVGQPAEETLEGAAAMLADDLYPRFGTPDVALAQHTAPLPAGSVAHSLPGQGPTLAASLTLDVVVHGVGGHAGTPQLAVDPVVTAAAAVLRLQTVVSRETAPGEQLVLTVGRLRAGTQPGVVADRAELGLSVRARSAPALARAREAVERIVRAECAASGCPVGPEVTVTSEAPALQSDEAASAAVRAAHTRQFGPARVLPWPTSMATEDFARFATDGVRTAYWMLGAAGAAQWRAAQDGGDPVVPNHSPYFAPDVRTALPTGIAALTVAALDALDTSKEYVP